MTEPKISRFEIVVAFMNKGLTFNKRKGDKSKDTVSYVWNGAIYEGDYGILLGFNPLQKGDKSTPVFAVLEDGNRTQIDSKHFFQAFGEEEWFHITTELDEDEIGDLYDDERSDRTIGVKLIVQATNIKTLEQCFVNKGCSDANKQSKRRRNLGFNVCAPGASIEYINYESGVNLSPVKVRYMPSLVKPVEVIPVSNEAAKSVLNAPITKKDIELIDSETEHIVIDEGTPLEVESAEELDALFAASKPSSLKW